MGNWRSSETIFREGTDSLELPRSSPYCEGREAIRISPQNGSLSLKM